MTVVLTALLALGSTDVDFFEKRIRPVLVEHCYRCHSDRKAKGGLRLDSRAATRSGGDSGPAVVPGDVKKSLLLEAISYSDESLEMPPNGKLPARTIADFKRWIEMGAPDPREEVVPEARTRAGTVAAKDFWAFRRPTRHGPPAVKGVAWPRSDIDTFILARLEQEGLSPSRDADRSTLLRRVTFDLTGLPPTPSEIEAFLGDPSPDAFETVVDRLLSSPGFGDHWARHWFDLSCYADLGDIDGNVVLRDAWRYRDYVVRAFNSDKPLDRFVREQIAGDLLRLERVEERREAIVATGFLAIGPWTLQNYIKGQLHADVVDHQIEKIGRVFLGMSLGCARCHDHKFDPIPTRDYYALAGIFHSTLTTRHDGPGVWSDVVRTRLPETPRDEAERQRKAVEHDRKVEELTRRRYDLEEERGALYENLVVGGKDAKGVSSSMNSLSRRGIEANERGVMFTVSFEAGPTVWAGASQSTSERDGVRIEILRPDGAVLARHTHRPGAWKGTSDAQAFERGSFSYTGDGTGHVTVRLTPVPRYAGRFGGALDTLLVTSDKTVVFSEDFDEYTTQGSAGKQAHTGLRVFARGEFRGWTGGGINHSHAVERSDGNHALQLFSGSPPSLASHPAKTEEEKRVHARLAEINGEIGSIPARLVSLDYTRPGAPEALAVRDVASPTDSPIYVRGDFRSPGKTVPRGFLTAVADSRSERIEDGTSGRRELARWLTHPENPLTTRVLVNRIWHHLFGAGLVRSVDDFGVHGDRPSHPELLDDLAVGLVEDGWSLKGLIRSLVLSRTYAMASEHDPDSTARDPDNRLLWRMNRRRLEAESIRDSLLAVSGELDRSRGGPSLGLEIPGNVAGIGGNVNPPTYTGRKLPDTVARRRSIFLPLFRRRPAGPLEILSVFDFPHPSSITGARAETTVATQALFMMNAPFVKERARATARRVLAEPGLNDGKRVTRLFLLAVSRRPDAKELDASLRFLAEYEKACSREQEAPADPRLEAWTEFCHALLASNGFLFRE